MIRFRIKELLAEKGFQEGRIVTLGELSKDTGIHRSTLSKIANEKGYSTVTENVDKLCKYFECEISDLLVFVPDQAKTD